MPHCCPQYPRRCAQPQARLRSSPPARDP
jgi:hypothetical protein